METVSMMKSKSGRMPVDTKSKSGRVQVDAQKQSGRGRLDGRCQSGRVPVDRIRIIHPEADERGTAQRYFRFYDPAFGKRLSEARIGVESHGTSSQAHVGELVYYSIIADIPPSLYGPYRILDIRRVQIPNTMTPASTHIYIDRFDFFTPLLPTRLVGRSIVEPYDTM